MSLQILTLDSFAKNNADFCSPEAQPQDPPDEYNDYGVYNEYGDDYYGTGDDYYGEPAPPDNPLEGSPAPDEAEVEAARYDYRGNRDPCAGVFCPEIDCNSRPYIPEGECCPVCPGQSNYAPVRPELQVICNNFFVWKS